MTDYEIFIALTYEEYDQDRNKRRNVERWVENIVNSSIDIARIVIPPGNRGTQYLFFV